MSFRGGWRGKWNGAWYGGIGTAIAVLPEVAIGGSARGSGVRATRSRGPTVAIRWPEPAAEFERRRRKVAGEVAAALTLLDLDDY